MAANIKRSPSSMQTHGRSFLASTSCYPSRERIVTNDQATHSMRMAIIIIIIIHPPPSSPHHLFRPPVPDPARGCLCTQLSAHVGVYAFTYATTLPTTRQRTNERSSDNECSNDNDGDDAMMTKVPHAAAWATSRAAGRRPRRRRRRRRRRSAPKMPTNF